MNGLMLFEKVEFGKLRSAVIDGELWFVGKDACDCLELGNHLSSLALIDEDEKGIHTMDTPGGAQEFIMVSEAGLYTLIFKSRKEKAREFRRWVTHEVIPSIRKTGSYAVQGTQGTSALPDFSNPAEAARAWANEYEQKQLAIRQRDEALRTKAWISTRSQATAMATASAATRENNKLKNELGRGKDYKQVSAIPWLLDMFRESGGMYSQVGRKLADLSRQMGIDFISVEDTRYGTVKAYHVSVIEAFRLKLLQDKNMLGKYRV